MAAATNLLSVYTTSCTHLTMALHSNVVDRSLKWKLLYVPYALSVRIASNGHPASSVAGDLWLKKFEACRTLVAILVGKEDDDDDDDDDDERKQKIDVSGGCSLAVYSPLGRSLVTSRAWLCCTTHDSSTHVLQEAF